MLRVIGLMLLSLKAEDGISISVSWSYEPIMYYKMGSEVAQFITRELI